MESDLYQIRSLGGCTKAAYELFVSNIATILKQTWLPALLVAIATTASLYMLIFMGAESFASPNLQVIITKFAILIVTFLCSVAFFSWHNGIILSLITGQNRKQSIIRVARVNAIYVAMGILFTAVIGAIFVFISLQQPPIQALKPTETAPIVNYFTVSLLVTLATIIIFAIAVIPLLYSSVQYLVEPKQKIFSIFTHGYLTGLKRWGFLFLLTFILNIIVTIILAICYLPISILTISQYMNLLGTFIGDANTLPTLFPVIFIATSLLVQFIIVYVATGISMVYYYAYGSIEAQNK
ncbi:MAG: hypothetical protein HG447_000910 [Prevotella sp.]|jgi:hypothetical protein|nr:hypothetical protein [Prevotella sp.]